MCLHKSSNEESLENTDGDKRLLNGHAARHSGDKTFYHEICNKKLASSSALCSHNSKAQSDEGPFQCEIKSQLDSHKVTHFEKHLSCKVCGKNFKTEAWLRQHATVHSEDRPFSCKLC